LTNDKVCGIFIIMSFETHDSTSRDQYEMFGVAARLLLATYGVAGSLRDSRPTVSCRWSNPDTRTHYMLAGWGEEADIAPEFRHQLSFGVARELPDDTVNSTLYVLNTAACFTAIYGQITPDDPNTAIISPETGREMMLWELAQGFERLEQS
jgi:hypothetical protein